MPHLRRATTAPPPSTGRHRRPVEPRRSTRPAAGVVVVAVALTLTVVAPATATDPAATPVASTALTPVAAPVAGPHAGRSLGEDRAARDRTARPLLLAGAATADPTTTPTTTPAPPPAAPTTTTPVPAPPPAPTHVLPAQGRYTSCFCERWGDWHGGLDLANATGTPEVAAAAGTVIVAGPAGGFGQWVQIRHDDGTVTVYGHMATIEVAVGQQVAAGELIATMGAQGNSTGPHLHFEVWPGGDRGARIDPADWLTAHGVTLPEYTP